MRNSLGADGIVLNHVRSRGHRGGLIPMHRALAHFRLRPMNLVTSISLFFFFTSIWLALVSHVGRFWTWLLGWSLSRLPLQASLQTSAHHLSSFRLQIPYLRIAPALPGPLTWILTCAVTLLLFALTYFLPHRLMPVVYLSRAILLIQASALIYFALWPLQFKHTPDSYMEAMANSGIALISIVPLVFALTYYIFDFGLWKKAFLTTLTMTHLAIFLPFQFLLQALVLQQGVLFMPVLYIVLGIALDVMLIIAFYSWGMTWSFRPTS